MNLVIRPGGMIDSVQVPSSKSYANRALILASLREEEILLRNMPHATDVTHLISALQQIGLSITQDKKSLRISGSFPECETKDQLISVGEGGTTARFLAVLLLKGKMKYSLKLGNRLKDRPWEEFLRVANDLGAKAELRDDTLTIQGPIHSEGSIIVDCQRTTQFLTAFQLVFGEEREILSSHLETSQSYVKMTEEMIRVFRKKTEYDIPLDWSSASYPLAFSVLNAGAEFPGLMYDPFQADAKIYKILSDHDALQTTPFGLRSLPLTQNFSLKLDVSDCLDLVPTLAFLLAHIPGTHHLSGVENLQHKESDRLSECLKVLQIFERKAEVREGVFIIEGHAQKVSKALDITLPDDHRMVMMSALFLRHHCGGSLTPAEAVEKSYPNFFELLGKLR